MLDFALCRRKQRQEDEMPPLVSAIIPTFNRATLLPRALRSVLAQTWRPLQLVIVNDGSTDNTVEVLAQLEPEIRAANVEPTFVNKPNGGCSSSRNAGVRAVKGEYFGILDDDDWWLPDKISHQMAEIEKTGADACACFTSRLRGRYPRTPGSAAALPRGRSEGARFVARQCNAHINSLLVKTSLIERVGYFDETLRWYTDEDWKARLFFEADMCSVEEELNVYSLTEESMTRMKDLEATRKRDAAFMRHLELIKETCAGKPNWSDEAYKHRAAHVYDECAKHLLYLGELKGARELYEQGLKLCGPIGALPKLRKKLLKAKVLSWFGLKPRHPKMREAVS